MNKVLYIILISLFSLTVFSCSEDKEESTTDTTAPVIAEVTAVTTPTNDSTPNYTFSSDEAGTITYGGSCSSSIASAISGNNTITLVSLSDGTYSDCTITVTDSSGNVSNTLTITSFTINTLLSNVKSLSSGGYDTCALINDGTVKCWGHLTGSTTPISINISGVSQISTGWDHTCAKINSSTVKCWGENSNGQLGDGNTTSWGTKSNTPVTVLNLTNVDLISSGYYYSFALLTDNTVKGWGRNASGQLGDGTTTDNRTTPVSNTSLTNVDNLSSLQHSCALFDNDTVDCWGRTSYTSQLGNNSATNVIDVQAGWHSSCALINGGTIKCWGNQGSHGQLGNGSLTESTAPVSVSGISNATQITAGEMHNCALLSDNTVKCWGENTYGQLGDGTKTNRTTPVLVTDLSDVKQVSAGRSHTCALLNAGTVKCWSVYVAGSITPVYVYE